MGFVENAGLLVLLGNNKSYISHFDLFFFMSGLLQGVRDE